MTQPIVEQKGAIYRFTWEEEGVAAVLRRIREHGSYTRGEVTWLSVSPGEKGHLHQGLLSLNSSTAKAQLARLLTERHPEKDWTAIIEQLTVQVLRRYRRGEPVVTIRTNGDTPEPIPYAICPLLFEALPFVFFGEPGTMKSYLALLLAAIAANQATIPGLPFAPQRSFTPLYLDWESTLDDQRRRLARLEKGLGISIDGKVHYRFCTGPLASDIERIQELALDIEADLIVIDSLGPAAGGDLNLPQAAGDFYAALRTLQATAIILAHVSKNADPRKRSIFGSQFFGALARGTAEVKAFHESGEEDVCIGVYHRKSNQSRLQRPFGIRFTFDGDSGPVTVHSQDLRKVPELSESLSVAERITELLTGSSRTLRPKDITEMLDVSGNTVRQTLRRMLDRKQVVQLDDGSYGALTREEEADASF
jgi:DNA-binding CsgD family transcriptional regulator